MSETAYRREARYVQRVVAALLAGEFDNGSEWLYAESDPGCGPPDEYAVRRREKALRKIIADLRRKAARDEGKPKRS